MLLDNSGADTGTAARLVYKLSTDPSFILSIQPHKLGASTMGATESISLAAYICGPKFVFYLLATLVYLILRFLSLEIIPLSALFFTNLFCFFGSLILLYLVSRKSGNFSNRIFSFMLPVFLLSLPSVYYLVYIPTYPHMLVFFFLSSIYTVIRAYDGDFRRAAFMLFASGLILGLTLGGGSQAPMIIFTGVVFTGFVALSKRLFFKSVLLQSLGILSAVTVSELAYRIYGASFIQLIWLHTFENVYANHLEVPFPFIPFIYLRIIFAIAPVTLVVFLVGICSYKWWWKNVTFEGRSLFFSLIIVLFTFSFLPTTPLFRIIFPVFIIMQICVLLIVLNLKIKVVQYIVIALLLSETLVLLPSTLFIKSNHGGHKSPLSRLDDERAIVKYFGYENLLPPEVSTPKK